MSDYTSGPWTYKPFGVYGQQDILGAPDKGGYKLNIATVHNAGSAEAREANARLIAAAPELAAVLIEYEELEGEMILDGKCWNGETLPVHYFNRLIELQHKRNEALEKAGYSFEMRAKVERSES